MNVRIALGTSLSLLLLAPLGCSAATDTDAPLGSGESDYTKRPEDVVVQFVNGGSDACARAADGRVFCWGAMPAADGSTFGLTVRPERDRPMYGITDARSIAFQYSDWCVLHTSGEVSCWGFHTDGGYIRPEHRPAKMRGIDDAVAIDGKCARLATGKVACWKELEGANPKVEIVEGVDDVVQVADPGRFSCALRQDSTVVCWGELDQVIGQYGYSPPTSIPHLEGVAEIAAGRESVCARKRDGHVVCWGDPNGGVLGIGRFDTWNRDMAEEVAGIDDAAKLAMTDSSACAVLSTGGVKCWGIPALGGVASATPSDVPDLSNIVDLHLEHSGSEMGGATACALAKDGEAFCWGRATYSLWGTMDIGYTSRPKRSIAFDAF